MDHISGVQVAEALRDLRKLVAEVRRQLQEAQLSRRLQVRFDSYPDFLGDISTGLQQASGRKRAGMAKW